MLTQADLEREMYAFGRNRAEKMMARNEEGGRANNNPYASAIFRRFVLPLAEVVREDTETRRVGRRKAHAALLEPLDPEAVAYLAVRSVLNSLLNKSDESARNICSSVGKACYHELCLALFETADPALFYTLVNDLGRRLSKSERHRMTVFKMQARENGIPVPEWGSAGVTQVGSYLVDQLEKLGMVETATVSAGTGKGKHTVRNTIHIRLTEELLEKIEDIRELVVETTPYFLPCVERPKDWVSMRDGGFHTNEMRRLQPFAVKGLEHRADVFEGADMSIPLGALNALQSTPWQINGDVLDTIRLVAKHFDMDEVLSQADFPAPPKPDWLFGEIKSTDMTPPQLEEFIHWKRSKAEWFTQIKLRGTKYGRFYTATSVADKFRDFPAIYFVHFADFRGRLYAQTTGVSPQGSDMQKALLRFATGKALDTLEAERWFCINGANKFGYDKESLDDRVKWVADRRELLLAFADDPVANDDWREADCPLQFLAWCLEYAEWQRNPHTFKSHLPVGMDGSCNGLQNFSAMLRDELGGRATNLVPSPKPNDIYQMVADVTALMLRRSTPDDAGYRDKWLMHGLNRTLVKRSVMTLPYGSTRFACADFIVGDYMRAGKTPEFPKEEYGKAAQYLSHFVWDGIGDVVVKAREAMDWLQACSTKIIKGGEDEIMWVAPSGFPVLQTYREQDVHRVRTNLCGSAFLRLNLDNDTPDKSRHKNGVAPNFIHSHDGAHLALTAVAGRAERMSLAFIHDDYGTHAADAEGLYRLIRSTFVRMYEEHDPLEDFYARYAHHGLAKPPAKGSLDIRLVLESPYFFS